MPLISCPECKTQVSDQAAACIHCGYPIQKKAEEAAALASSKRLLEGNPAYDKETTHSSGRFLDENPNYSRSSHGQISSPGYATEPRVVKTAKSRGVYIILGLFFGLLGVHNFYAGYLGRGAIQLLLVLLLGWFVVGLVVVGIWVIIELFTVRKDAAGDPLV
jgi:TM2 domain-containing membrane protein YozV